MIIYILFSAITFSLCIATYIITKNISKAKHDIYQEQAKAKALLIEQETKTKLKYEKQEAHRNIQELKERTLQECEDLQNNANKIDLQIKEKLKNIEIAKNKYNNKLKNIKNIEETLQKQIDQAKENSQEALKVLYEHKYLTIEEAREYILKQEKENLKLQLAKEARKLELLHNQEVQRKANFLLAQATTRFAHEFTNTKLVNHIHIEHDDIKGRIIGKDGRNIALLKNLLGVNIIIDETPNAILISDFSLYRRAIATRTIELLIEDGRIQPARIETIYEKVKQEFQEQVLLCGQNVVLDLGISDIHPELVKLIGQLQYRTSYGQNALDHSIEVALFASTIASELGGDAKLAKRAGILHDIGKALTTEHNGSHIELGAQICEKYNECDTVINAIYAHHDLRDPINIESASVCTGDVLSAAIPGARCNSLNNLENRVTSIEKIAYKHNGVITAYAIDAGRELRVVVSSKVVDDLQTNILARDIAKTIENEVQYPGSVKVSVIREVKSTQYAM